MDKHFLFAKKSLGQNFLNSPKAVEEIIKTAEISPGQTVLEIGPGKGVLTKKLLEHGAKITAIEKDQRMFDYLKEELKDFIPNQLELHCRDILECDDVLDKLKPNYKLIANIPYYITGAIIRKFLSTKKQPERMVLLVQKEVAERIVTKDKKESLLSISVKAYCQPKYIQTIKAGSFTPAPKVDSAIVLFENITKSRFKKEKVAENIFFEIVKEGFAHKRKKLAGNLSDLFKTKGGNKNSTAEIFEELGINIDARAENLTVNDWFSLAKKLSN